METCPQTIQKKRKPRLLTRPSAIKYASALLPIAFCGWLDLRSWNVDRVLRNDIKTEFDRNISVELHLHGVLAEGLDRGVEMDALLLYGEASRDELVVDVVHGDRAEHLAAFARLHGECKAGLLKLLTELLSTIQLERLALGATLFKRLDLLTVRRGNGRSKATWQEIITCITGTHFDLVAFAAETFDGLDEEDFAGSHFIMY